MTRVQIQVEGPSDKTVVHRILEQFSFCNISIRSGHGHMKGKDAMIKYFDLIVQDDRVEKILLFMDDDARKDIRDLARKINIVPRPVFVILIPGLENWVRQLLDSSDVPEYDRILRNGNKVEAARWATGRFQRNRLQADPVVQKLLAFCGCKDLPDHRFPEDFQ